VKEKIIMEIAILKILEKENLITKYELNLAIKKLNKEAKNVA